MVTQGAHSQWLQCITVKSRRLLGNTTFSMYLTQVRSTPIGTSCSLLQATVQAWQPIHLRLSMTKPNFGMASTSGFGSARGGLRLSRSCKGTALGVDLP